MNCYEHGHVNELKYDWHVLVTYIMVLQKDPSILSKFQLMAMHRRMQGFYTRMQTKAMLTEYHARNRDLWTKEEIEMYKNNYIAGHKHSEEEDGERNLLDEQIYQQEHRLLSTQVTNNLRRKSDHVQKVAGAIEECFFNQDKIPVQDLKLRHQQNSTDDKPFFCRVIGAYAYLDKPVVDVQALGRLIMHDKTPPPLTGKCKERDEKYDVGTLLAELKLRLFGEDGPNPGQAEFLAMYEEYFRNPNSVKCKVPPVAVLQGTAGTGKSTVAKAIYQTAEIYELATVRTSFNSGPALDIEGYTTASLICLNGKQYMEQIVALTEIELKKFWAYIEPNDVQVVLILVDEISTIAPWHLACLHYACQQHTNKFKKPFGGIPALLVGDLRQLGPVRAGPGLATAAMDIVREIKARRARGNKSS